MMSFGVPDRPGSFPGGAARCRPLTWVPAGRTPRLGAEYLHAVEGDGKESGHQRAAEGALAYDRLEDQISWYDRKSAQSQRRFKTTKGSQMLLAAAIPVLAAFHAPVAVGGGFAPWSSC
jgi:hypothetical protein